MHVCNEPRKKNNIHVKRRRKVIWHNAHTMYSEGWKRATDRAVDEARESECGRRIEVAPNTGSARPATTNTPFI